jgi:hypothetical protein
LKTMVHFVVRRYGSEGGKARTGFEQMS